MELKKMKSAVMTSICAAGVVMLFLTSSCQQAQQMLTGKKAEEPAPAPAAPPAAPAAPSAPVPAAPPMASATDAGAPTDAKLNLQQGMNYLRLRDFDNAIKEFTLAIGKYPRFDTAYSNRAVAYMQQRKFNKAMDDLKEAVEINPKNPTVHYNFTCLYSLQKQLDRSLDSLDRALELGFNDYDALRNDPDLDNVRRHHEFRKILEKYKVFIVK